MNREPSFDPSVHQKELLKAWRKCIETGEVDHSVVPFHIAVSWERSYKNKVDPFTCKPSDSFDPKIFKRRIFERQYLLNLSKPFMEGVYALLDSDLYIVVLYDADGYHLLRMGRIAEFEKTSGFHIEGQPCFEENRMGTCGFSLVKSTGKPMQIVGCEHYAAFLHRISGYYAPICCPIHGDLLGVIGIAGAATRPNNHTLESVTVAALAIENMIKLERSRQGSSVTNQFLQSVIDNLAVGVFFTDCKGRISEMNREAKAIFGFSAGEVRGQFVSEEILSPTLMELFTKVQKGRERKRQRATAKINGESYVVAAQWIGRSKQEEAGVLCHLKSVRYLSDILSEQPKECLSSDDSHKSGELLRKKLDHTGASFDDITGLSPRMIEIKSLVRWAARSEANVVLEGESGTGKEVFAHIIHNESARKAGPFIVINCSAIPSQLMESILFGHERGSFTSAIKTRIGKFELADGGTVFLDEIGEMPLDMQVKLLRVIEDRTIERIGGKLPINIDIRIIVATNRNLVREVKEGRFRDDLFYRLNVLRIYLPPLRDRIDEIYHLIPFFIQKISPLFNKRVDEISKAYYSAVENYSWPGNIRELRNAVEYSIAVLDGSILLEEHILGFFRQAYTEEALPMEGKTFENPFPLLRKDFTGDTIRQAIKDAEGNKLKAAENLSISRATLYRHLKKRG